MQTNLYRREVPLLQGGWFVLCVPETLKGGLGLSNETAVDVACARDSGRRDLSPEVHKPIAA